MQQSVMYSGALCCRRRWTTQLVLRPLRNVQPVQLVVQEMAESAVVLACLFICLFYPSIHIQKATQFHKKKHNFEKKQIKQPCGLNGQHGAMPRNV